MNISNLFIITVYIFSCLDFVQIFNSCLNVTFSDPQNEKPYFKFTNKYLYTLNLILHQASIIQNRILGPGGKTQS